MNTADDMRRRADMAALRFQFALMRMSLLELKYRPDQPRVPAGTQGGGQWTDDSGDAGGASPTGAVQLIPAGGPKIDAAPPPMILLCPSKSDIKSAVDEGVALIAPDNPNYDNIMAAAKLIDGRSAIVNLTNMPRGEMGDAPPPRTIDLDLFNVSKYAYGLDNLPHMPIRLGQAETARPPGAGAERSRYRAVEALARRGRGGGGRSATSPPTAR